MCETAARRRETSKRAARTSSSCRRATAASRSAPVLRRALSHAPESARARSGSLSAALIGRRELMPGPRLAVGGALNIDSLVLERRQDARSQRRWTAALDQLDQGVQVNRTLARELLAEPVVEAGLAQSLAAPGDDFGRPRTRAGVLSGSKVHVPLSAHTAALLTPDRRSR